MDDILYDTGLSFTSTIEVPNRRNFFCKPYVMFSFVALFLIQKFCALTTDDDFILLVFCCDVSHHYGHEFKLVFNVVLCLCSLLPLMSQTIYFVNHRRGIAPTFLRIFRSQNKQDASSKAETTKIDNIHKKFVKLVKFINLNKMAFYVFITLFHIFTMHLHFVRFWKILICSIFPTTLLCIFCYIFVNLEGIQIVYFYFLCQYFRIKLKNLSESIGQMNVRIRCSRIVGIVRTFDALYREIIEYNSSYWSKFLIKNWLIFGSAIVNLLCSTLLLKLPLFLTILILYVVVFLSALFLVIVLSAASVNHRANKCYQLFNKLFIAIISDNTYYTNSTKNRLRMKLKVILYKEEW